MVNLRIDGLSLQDYRTLMSPLRTKGEMGKHYCPILTHSLRKIANFFARLFYSIFVTHQWESDHNLMHHLWRDLNHNKMKNTQKIAEIKKIFNSLSLRLSPEDKEKIRVEQKLLAMDQPDDNKEPTLTPTKKTAPRLSVPRVSVPTTPRNQTIPKLSDPILPDPTNDKGADPIPKNPTDDKGVEPTPMVPTVSQDQYRAHSPLNVIAKMVELSAKLSGSNPKKSDQEILHRVYSLNHPSKFTNFEQLQSELLVRISPLPKPEWKDEIINLISCRQLKNDLRLKAGLLREGDLVCEFSQGRISDIAPYSGLTSHDGKNACASICAEAIFNMELDKKSLVKEEQLYAIIQKGVEGHKAKGYGSSAAVFSDLVWQINGRKDVVGANKLAAFALKPKATSPSPFAAERYRSPLLYPYQDRVKGGFENYITMIKEVSNETKKQLYGVLTCGHETVLIYYNQDDTLSLFDSHGRMYLGVSKGASVRKFNDVAGLGGHLDTLYSKYKTFSLLIVGTE